MNSLMLYRLLVLRQIETGFSVDGTSTTILVAHRDTFLVNCCFTLGIRLVKIIGNDVSVDCGATEPEHVNAWLEANFKCTGRVLNHCSLTGVVDPRNS